MEPNGIITISISTLTFAVFAFLGRIAIKEYFSFKEKNYENKLDTKLKEFETKLSNILPERILVIKSIYKILIKLQNETMYFIGVNDPGKELLATLNEFELEFALNEFYFNSNQREVLNRLIKEFTNCYIEFSTYKNYGDWQTLSQEEKKEKFEYFRNARNIFQKEIPKIKEEFIELIQRYYLIEE
jgi:hypothetical protein